MVKITAYIKPHRLEPVKTAVSATQITGLTVCDVRGTGNSAEQSAYLGGGGSVIATPIRTRITIVCRREQKEDVIQAIIENARTGEANDGKIFVETIEDAIRIRTQERGDLAV